MLRKKTVILLLACMALTTVMHAQDTDEFQRIARRIMDAYDIGDEVEHAPDSAHLYGGAYLGAASNGRAMPSGYITYLTDKLLFTSQLAVDFSEQSTDKDVRTDFLNGANRLTNTDILTKYEKQDFSTRLDYVPSKGNILTFGIIESFDHNRVNENTIKSFLSIIRFLTRSKSGNFSIMRSIIYEVSTTKDLLTGSIMHNLVESDKDIIQCT